MSEDKIVSIHGGNRSAEEADADLIEGIEDILAAAKAGHITGIALVAGTADGGVITGIHQTSRSNAFSMMGGVAHLFARADKDLFK